MKKVTNKQIAEKIGIVRQTFSNWEDNKPKLYKAVKGYFLLEENNFFENFKKIKALALLVQQECNSKYVDDLVKLIEEGDEVVENNFK